MRKRIGAVRGGVVCAVLCYYAVGALAQTNQYPTPPQASPPNGAPPPLTIPPPNDVDNTPPKPKFRWSDLHVGLDGQLYFPSSPRARDRFGDVWVSYTPSIGLVEMIAPKTILKFSAEVIGNRRRGNNRILLIPVGIAVRRGYRASDQFRPYYGVNAALTPYSMRVDDDNIGPGFRLGASLAPVIGVGFHRHAYVEAEYLWVSRFRGYDISGLSLSAGLRF